MTKLDSILKQLPEGVDFSQSRSPADAGTQERIGTPQPGAERKEALDKAKADKDPKGVLENLLPDDDDIFRV